MITSPDSKHPQGMVLAFTLVILALLAVLGISLFLSTKDEYDITVSNTMSRTAFTNADLTNRIATFLARTSLISSAGKPEDSLATGGIDGRPRFLVNMATYFGPNFFYNLGEVVTKARITDLYEGALGSDETGKRNFVTIQYQYGEGAEVKNYTVGSASIGLGTPRPDDPSGSIADGEYDQLRSGSTVVYLVVAADGRAYEMSDGSEAAKSRYLSGDRSGKHSVVVSIFQNYLGQ